MQARDRTTLLDKAPPHARAQEALAQPCCGCHVARLAFRIELVHAKYRITGRV